MTLVQKEVKAVYLWTTKVRPTPIYSYSYTFKWKTSSQISNDWSTLIGTINTNSDWVTWTSNSELRIKVDIPSLTTAKKITISGTFVVNQNSYNGMSFIIWTWSWWGSGFAGWNAHGSNFHGISTTYYNGTDHFWNVVGYTTIGTYTPTITIDLENKTINETLSWFSNSTNTFTNSDIATIRQFNQLIVYVYMNKTAVSDVSILIE